ncbi:hypothetical protein CA13_63590 [Planctomycetes bacterium CA13]|uniref:Uncharacterized protein n=1 Tax=Novipirellula herctigrandis TaxID=2527986 RepID=A0A5C5ZCK4_9BACT|nr:hypothetical protein CA13_63590 [Planctomycetes bacterium CA13]
MPGKKTDVGNDVRKQAGHITATAQPHLKYQPIIVEAESRSEIDYNAWPLLAIRWWRSFPHNNIFRFLQNRFRRDDVFRPFPSSWNAVLQRTSAFDKSLFDDSPYANCIRFLKLSKIRKLILANYFSLTIVSHKNI